jgi:hypothetical protein
MREKEGERDRDITRQREGERHTETERQSDERKRDGQTNAQGVLSCHKSYQKKYSFIPEVHLTSFFTYNYRSVIAISFSK